MRLRTQIVFLLPRAILFALVFAFIVGFLRWQDGSFDQVLNHQVFKSGSFEIRTTHTFGAFSFDTQCVVFESGSPDTQKLKRFLQSCGDLADDFSGDDLHFLDGQKAYLIYRNYFATTVNAGQTWAVLDAMNPEFCKKNLRCSPDPQTLRIDSDGAGTMKLEAWSVYPARDWHGAFSLETRDFGQTWHTHQVTR